MISQANAKILVIDDEYVLRQSIIAYLEDSGFVVCEGENGQHGLEVFRRELPDLVLTDLQMPVMGGLEVLKTIVSEAPNIPIIVISGTGGMDDIIEALCLGAWDYLTKPITDLNVLEHAIHRALERGRLISENKEYARTIEKNLSILEEDQVAGRSVQMKLLPQHNLNFQCYSFDYRVVPSLYLSGDFVDYFRITESKIGFYLADVSGHGASSAFITVLLKSLLAQISARYQINGDKTIVNPESVMQEISHDIYTAKLGKYMTMIYGILDLDTNQCIYGVGGHYPNPILLNSNKEASYLDGKGFPIGIIDNVQYQSNSVIIPEGGKLIMFSDGIMEIFMPDKNMQQQEAALLSTIQQYNGDIVSIFNKLGINDQDTKETKDKSNKNNKNNKNKEYPVDITMLVVSHNFVA